MDQCRADAPGYVRPPGQRVEPGFPADDPGPGRPQQAAPAQEERDQDEPAGYRPPVPQEGHVVDVDPGCSGDDGGQGQGQAAERAGDQQRVEEQRVNKAEPQRPGQRTEIVRDEPEQDRGQAAGPLELLDQHGREGVRPVAVRLGGDREHAVPANRVEQEAGREVLGEFGPEPADVLQRGGPYRIVRSDAGGRPAVAVPQLERSVKGRLPVQAAAGRP